MFHCSFNSIFIAALFIVIGSQRLEHCPSPKCCTNTNMVSKCNKFLPNIFNKTKCQHCFAAKDVHSAEALENNRATRKVLKCGYLFVSPGLDFTNPADRNRRWQRRFFRLYDDGELTYCVDENPDTVPQAVLDMNGCTDVQLADAVTSHPFSLSVTVPEQVLYIKGSSKEEINRWHEVLGEYPKALTILKLKKVPRSQSVQKDFSNLKHIESSQIDGKLSKFDSRIESPAYSTFRGVRSLKHRFDSGYQDGLRKSSSLHDLSSEDNDAQARFESSRFLSRSGDMLDSLHGSRHFSLFTASPNGQLHHLPSDQSPVQSLSQLVAAKEKTYLMNQPESSLLPTESTSVPLLGSSSEKETLYNQSSESSAASRRQDNRELLRGLRELSFQSSFDDAQSGQHQFPSQLADGKKLIHVKKGWLVVQALVEKESKKYWFVLNGTSLKYYLDAKAEEANLLEGAIDLSSCYEVLKVDMHRNFGFKIKTLNGEYTLASMTSGIRDNWIKAIRQCMDMYGTNKYQPSVLGVNTSSPLVTDSGHNISRTALASETSDESTLEGQSDAYRRKHRLPARRSHSDVNPGHVNKALTVHEFSTSLKNPEVKSSANMDKSNSSSLTSVRGSDYFKSDSPKKTNNISTYRNDSKENALRSSKLKSFDAGNSDTRFVEGSDSSSVQKYNQAHSPAAWSKEKSQQGKDNRLQNSLDEYRIQKGEEDQLDGNIELSDLQTVDSVLGKETSKEQLREARETIQRQRFDIDSLKNKLDISVSKLSSTEKALSEALKENKQEKDKFLKISSEWHRQIRSLENQNRDLVHKLENSREALQQKERDYHRLEVELKRNLQRMRDGEKEILKLKAVEHEYNQLKERLDDRQLELSNLRSELRAKEELTKKLKMDFEQQLEELDREYVQERDDLEQHMEQLKSELYSVHDRSLKDTLSSNIGNLLKEKDSLISRLEAKVDAGEKKLADLSQELQVEMAENVELAEAVKLLQGDKTKLQVSNDDLRCQIFSLKTAMSESKRGQDILTKQTEKQPSSNQTDHTSLSSQKDYFGAPSSVACSEEEKSQDKTTKLEKREDNRQQDKNASSVSGLCMACQLDFSERLLGADYLMQEVNNMMFELRQKFDLYVDSLSSDSKGRTIYLANLIEDIGQKCQSMKSVLWESHQKMFTLPNSECLHEITVDTKSSQEAIMSEYKSLKLKFDKAVAELNHFKGYQNKENQLQDFVKQENKKLLETLEKRVSHLIVQVEKFTAQCTSNQSGSRQAGQSPSSDHIVEEITRQLSELEQLISVLQQKVTLHRKSGTDATSADINSFLGKLQDIRLQLTHSVVKLKDLNSHASNLQPHSVNVMQSQLNSIEERIHSVASSIQSLSKLPGSNVSSEDMGMATGGFVNCLRSIRERILEVAEQLDSIDDDDDEDDEDSYSQDGDPTIVEEVREKLSHLTEYIEQHCKLTPNDWALLELLTLQGNKFRDVDKIKDAAEVSETSDEKLKHYADKLSLEAVLLIEIAHMLQARETLMSKDPVIREMNSLNNNILLLHHRVDNEVKTMHLETAPANLLKSYAEVIAEKMLMFGGLQTVKLAAESESSENPSACYQPKLLAAEAVVRSQIDAFISNQLDRSADEILALPSYLAARVVVQGELTHFMNKCRDWLQQKPEMVLPGGGISPEFLLDRLLERQKEILVTCSSYTEQMVHALAVIIFKESEKMTVVESPETVLEAMCSELSTIIEKHIQSFKKKSRSSNDTYYSHKYECIVGELRCTREAVISEIKSKHAVYASNPSAVRDSSLDIPVQSLDTSMSHFGEILSLKSVVVATIRCLGEQLAQGQEIKVEGPGDSSTSLAPGLASFACRLSQALQEEASAKHNLAKTLGGRDQKASGESVVDKTLVQCPQLLSGDTAGPASVIIREVLFSTQLTFSLLKQKLVHDIELNHLRSRQRFKTQGQLSEDEKKDSSDLLDLHADFQTLMAPMEDVLGLQRDSQLLVLSDILEGLTQLTSSAANMAGLSSGPKDTLQKLIEKLHQEMEMSSQEHETHVQSFRQEMTKLEKMVEDLLQDRDQCEERCALLEDELTAIQLQHEEETDRVKQDIQTAVNAIRSSDQKSELNLMDHQASKLSQELTYQKLHFKKILVSLKKEVNVQDKTAVIQAIEDHIATISFSTDEEPIEKQMDQVEQLKREREEAIADEIKNTKAALDAVRSAYEEELTKERAKYREALLTMYTEDYVTEIRLRHQEEEKRLSEELQKLNMHYTSKCEDYKLLEMKIQQTKTDYEGHIQQLSSSNASLEDMLSREINQLKDFIQTKHSKASLTTGSATLEEELYDAKIMVRVKDAELQRLRSQVKNLENSLHRSTEEQKQTMTQYMQLMKMSGELKKTYQEEVAQLTDKLHKLRSTPGFKANIKRTPSFHMRARSPSPQSSNIQKDHTGRDSHHRRRIHPKDLRRSKSSPSLPYVFDGKGAAIGVFHPEHRSRSPKS